SNRTIGSMRPEIGRNAAAVGSRLPARSGTAAGREMADKRSDYFAAETKAVWDVDLEGPDVVRVYRSSDPEHPIVAARSPKPSRPSPAGRCLWTTCSCQTPRVCLTIRLFH